MTVASRARAAAGGTTEFAPDDLAGLQLWLVAENITGLVDGDTVVTWPDLSGNGRNATQFIGAFPIYKTAILNGHPVVRFNGDDKLETTSYTQAQSFAVVGVVSTTDTTGPRDFHGSPAGNANVLVHAGNWKLYGGALLAGPAATTSPCIVTGVFDSTSSVVRLNGPASAVTGNAGTGGIASGSIIGAAGSEFWSGDIAELLVYGPAPVSGDLARIEQYLGTRYGITVT